jgi:hypothetical protein
VKHCSGRILHPPGSQGQDQDLGIKQNLSSTATTVAATVRKERSSAKKNIVLFFRVDRRPYRQWGAVIER